MPPGCQTVLTEGLLQILQLLFLLQHRTFPALPNLLGKVLFPGQTPCSLGNLQLQSQISFQCAQRILWRARTQMLFQTMPFSNDPLAKIEWTQNTSRGIRIIKSNQGNPKASVGRVDASKPSHQSALNSNQLQHKHWKWGRHFATVLGTGWTKKI